MPVAKVRALIARGKRDLLRIRGERNTPVVDRTILTDRNAMMISAYLEAYKVLGREELKVFALKSLEFLLRHASVPGKGMAHAYVDGTLVQDLNILRDFPGEVVVVDGVDKRRQVGLCDLLERHFVGVALGVVAPEVMEPQHMIVLRLQNHSGKLGLELLVLDVPNGAGLHEFDLGSPLDQRVQLPLFVVLLRLQGQLVGQPDEAGI